MSHRVVLHINELTAARAGADLKEAWAGGGRLRRARGARSAAQPAPGTHRRAQRGRAEPEARPGQRELSRPAGRPPQSLLPRRAPAASMRLLSAALLLLLLALCAARVDGECPGGLLSPSRHVLGRLGANCWASRGPGGPGWALRAVRGRRPRAQLNGTARSLSQGPNANAPERGPRFDTAT